MDKQQAKELYTKLSQSKAFRGILSLAIFMIGRRFLAFDRDLRAGNSFMKRIVRLLLTVPVERRS